jgi:8-oxo-dGTP pyrophosphatase MutT (NUDIX family)
MDCWTLPGGAVDPHEQPADAATRECFEERGLLVKVDAPIGGVRSFLFNTQTVI